MKKRGAAMLLCLLLIMQMTMVPARAEKDVYFVAAGSHVLPMSDETMPFWSNGYLYVSSTIFTGIVWNVLGISHVPANSKQPLILYSGGDRSLIFDAKKNYAQDAAGSLYYPGAIRRNGNVFVPASLVANFFDLQYSLVDNVDHGYLVWLRKPDYGLGDKAFADAATYPMADCYAQYLQNKAASQTTPGMNPGIETPGVEFSGKRVYLCVEADEDTGLLLDVLGRQEAQAAFFCSQEFLETKGDLLRRMAVTGQAIGLLLDGGDSDLSIEEQIEAGNHALMQATCGKTRLVYIKNGTDAAVQQAEEAGFRHLEPDINRAPYGLQSSADANTLLRRVKERRGDVAVWLGTDVSTVGLRAFLNAAEDAGSGCLAWTETA